MELSYFSTGSAILVRILHSLSFHSSPFSFLPQLSWEDGCRPFLIVILGEGWYPVFEMLQPRLPHIKFILPTAYVSSFTLFTLCFLNCMVLAPLDLSRSTMEWKCRLGTTLRLSAMRTAFQSSVKDSKRRRSRVPPQFFFESILFSL